MIGFVTDVDATGQIGHARSASDAEALARFDQRMALPLVVSAVVPLFLLPAGADPLLTTVVFTGAWLVFLVDLVVRERRLVHYLRTWLGRFDLVVVVLTAPWFLIVATGTGKFVILIRLARVARVVMATRGARRLFARLGAVAAVAVGVVVVGAAVAYRAEHATNPEFKTFGDALWWSIVTLTTVGYGDIVPETTAGRVDGVMIMVAGVSVLGLLAGSMASFFGLGSGTSTSPPTPTSDESRSRYASATEIAELQTQVARLVDEVARLAPPENSTTVQSFPNVPE
jgi:voltage-gated potassium channel